MIDNNEVPRVVQVTEQFLFNHIQQACYRAWLANRNGYVNFAIEERKFANRLNDHLNRLKWQAIKGKRQ